MRHPFRFFMMLVTLFSALLACALVVANDVHAQPAQEAATSIGSAYVDTSDALVQPFIVSLAASYPWLVTLLTVIAALRLVFKPLMSALHAYVQSTASPTDDELLARVEHSRAYKVAAWLLDYLGSIKVGPQKPQPTATSLD